MADEPSWGLATAARPLTVGNGGQTEPLVTCRFCRSEETVKYGIRKNKGSFKQMFKCKRCARRFTPDNGFLKMKTEPTVVSEALDLYGKGLSLAKIQDHLFQRFQLKISKEGIRGWVNKYAAH